MLRNDSGPANYEVPSFIGEGVKWDTKDNKGPGFGEVETTASKVFERSSPSGVSHPGNSKNKLRSPWSSSPVDDVGNDCSNPFSSKDWVFVVDNCFGLSYFHIHIVGVGFVGSTFEASAWEGEVLSHG